MTVSIDSSRRDNLPFPSHDIRSRSDGEVLIDTVHHIRIPGFANTDDETRLNPDVSLKDPTPVNDKSISNDEVETLLVRSSACLTDTIAKRLPTPERTLITIDGEITLNLDPQIGRRQSD